MSERPLCVVVLAAGAGSRMRSARPKPLQSLCGQPMVIHVLDALSGVEADWTVLVVGHGSERVVKTLNEAANHALADAAAVEGGTPGIAYRPLHYVEQSVPKGTGDAVSVALASLPEELSDDADDADVLVMPGDTPLLEPSTIAALVDQHRYDQAAATVLTVRMADPTGYGRIVRDKHGHVRRIVEQSDATPDEHLIDEINTSIYCFRTTLLGPALRRITDANAQGEYYLTDVIEVLATAGHRVETLVASDSAQAAGVNDKAQLAAAEVELRRRVNERWMQAGVTMVDPARTYVDMGVRLEEDATLFPGTSLRGTTTVAKGAQVGPDVTLTDCYVGEGATVSGTTGSGASIGAHARVGPYVVLETGAAVPAGAQVHPFTKVTEE